MTYKTKTLKKIDQFKGKIWFSMGFQRRAFIKKKSYSNE